MIKFKLVLSGCIAASIAVGVYSARPAPVAPKAPVEACPDFLGLGCGTPEAKAYDANLDLMSRNSKALKRRGAARLGACLAWYGYVDTVPPEVFETDSEPRAKLYKYTTDKCMEARDSRKLNLRPGSFTMPGRTPGKWLLGVDFGQRSVPAGGFLSSAPPRTEQLIEFGSYPQATRP